MQTISVPLMQVEHIWDYRVAAGMEIAQSTITVPAGASQAWIDWTIPTGTILPDADYVRVDLLANELCHGTNTPTLTSIPGLTTGVPSTQRPTKYGSSVTHNTVVGWMPYGGIVRPVSLLVTDAMYLRNMKIDSKPDLKTGTAAVTARVWLHNAGPATTVAPTGTVAGLQAPTFMLFQVARFLGGLAIGAGSMLVPLYIAEASPADLRGRLVSFNQMAIVIGILLAYLVNWMFSFRGADAWRWMFAAALLPSAMLFAGMFVVPESPQWLIERGRDEEARIILKRIEGGNVDRQMDAIRVAVSQERSSFADLFAPALRRPLFFITALAVLSQITGMNTVLFYGTLIWEQHVGSSSHSAAIGANLTIGIVNFLGSIITLWLIERSGRRPLLLVSSASMAVCQLGLGLSFLLHPAPA